MTILALVCALVAIWTQAPITLFVGPQTRSGFVDVDQGTLDSIADIKGEFRGRSDIRVVERAEDAKVILYVIGRRRTSGAGRGVGIPVGAMTIYSASRGSEIDSLLVVGDYKRELLSGDDDTDTWRGAARAVAKDVTTWILTNKAQLTQ
jgi:hypothetical protein